MNANRWPDDTIIVRGGKSTPGLIAKSIATFPDRILGLSVVSAPGKSLIELASTLPHTTIRTSTIGVIRNAGGNVIPVIGGTPFRAILCDWRSIDAFTAGVKEPSHEGRKMNHDQRPRLYADFNHIDGNLVLLDCKGTLDDISSLGLTLREGMPVILDDQDDIVIDAIIRHSPDWGWVGEVDWQAWENGQKEKRK